ncbi:hypothetical protein N0V93_003885 [Gnomoniopsis smithogilvyi]|uniref:N-acetyltransferase domain-containing protein n=1 Tax=Gnomoniopsis smithogilvyi TaxID=1191159 RepID=A0A9W8YZJ7_9PEZI|nr:hypothetical protein N0V93_003885 [Gnomoniopsis smithogilvyi]
MTANLEDAWKTERLSFRSIRESDYEWWFNDIDSDPVNVALSSPFFLAPPRPKKPEEWYKMWDGPNELLDVVIYLCEPANSARPLKEGGDETDIAQSKETRIGFLRISYDHGYGTECVQWALDWAFRRANMHSVNLGSVEYNTRAHRCYEKCGFKLEGRRRQCFWHDRKWYDLFLYGILEEEWEELRNTKKSS